MTAYNEARTINRHEYGLLNEDQIPLIDRITDVMLELNKPAEAEEQQLEALRIVERSYPPESDEALAALYKYAGWLREQGRFQEERDQYMRALRTVHDHYGKDDVHEVPALLGIGESFRVQRIPEPQGAGALHDALQILTIARQHRQARARGNAARHRRLGSRVLARSTTTAPNTVALGQPSAKCRTARSTANNGTRARTTCCASP